MNIGKVIESIDDVMSVGGASDKDINKAESRLGLKFADDYIEYVKKYGIVLFGSHEITGICGNQRLDVCKITEKERIKNPDIPKTYYVIEELDIDDVVIWQAPDGRIYQSVPGLELLKISDNLSMYILDCNRE